MTPSLDRRQQVELALDILRDTFIRGRLWEHMRAPDLFCVSGSCSNYLKSIGRRGASIVLTRVIRTVAEG
jgi:hypothetical protein